MCEYASIIVHAVFATTSDTVSQFISIPGTIFRLNTIDVTGQMDLAAGLHPPVRLFGHSFRFVN